MQYYEMMPSMIICTIITYVISSTETVETKAVTNPSIVQYIDKESRQLKENAPKISFFFFTLVINHLKKNRLHSLSAKRHVLKMCHM